MCKKKKKPRWLVGCERDSPLYNENFLMNLAKLGKLSLGGSILPGDAVNYVLNCQVVLLRSMTSYTVISDLPCNF